MIFEQLYLGCLAQASYLIGDPESGDAVVVDPRRDVDVYLDRAAERGLTIRHVLLTHLHADFVAGHCELARRTGAAIHIGHAAGAEFEHEPLRDGQELRVGGLTIRVLETPGHTPESVCFLVSGDTSVRLLTGDTLFIGDVGRPDLVGSKGHTAEEMAGCMYDSIHAKILPLDDTVEIWPGHGAGSACGKNLSTERSSTLGAQRLANPMLQDLSRAEFVAAATSGLSAPPRYFPHDAATNRRGASGLDELPALPALDPAAFDGVLREGAQIVDVREGAAFGAGHLPGSLNIGLDGNLASWAGALLALERPILLVAADRDDGAEARTRLARVGLDHVRGFLAGGVESWAADGRELAKLEQVEVGELARRRAAPEPPLLLDVRGCGEYADAHARGAVSIPLPELAGRLSELPLERPLAVICQTGYRSSAAAGLLAASGASKVVNVRGGTQAWIEAGLPTERPETAGAV